MLSFAHRVYALAPIGVPTELPGAGTSLENPFAYDAAAREIKALASRGCTEVLSERHGRGADGEPVIMHMVFRRLN